MRSGLGVIAVELLLAGVAAAGLLASGVLAGREVHASGGWRFAAAPVGGAAEGRCAYNLARGPARVTVEPWGRPFSVAVTALDGKALSKADERSSPEGVDIVLALQGQATPGGARVVISPTRRGEVVQRRAAETPAEFAAADRARRGDQCGPTGLDFPAAPGG